MAKLVSSMAFCIACAGFAAQAHAAEFYATDLADSYVWGDGVCSLREAVDTANYNDCWADCGCGDPQDHVSRDVVYLAPDVTYQLDNLLEVWDSVEIVGGGSTMVRAGENGYFPGILVYSDAYDVVLSDFWLTNFRRAALIADTGSVVLTYGLGMYQNPFAVGAGQNAGVQAQPYSYTLLDGFVSADNHSAIKGAGIYINANATVELRNGFIVGNDVSQYGGGVHVEGTLFCTDSLITENRAGYAGGGIHVYTPTGHLYTSNCDVSNNTAPTNPNIHQ